MRTITFWQFLGCSQSLLFYAFPYPSSKPRESQITIPVTLLRDLCIHPNLPFLHTLHCHLNDCECGCAGLSSSAFLSSPPSSSASVGSRCLCGPLWRLPWRLPGRCRSCWTEACHATQSCCALHQTGTFFPTHKLHSVTSLPRLGFLVSLTSYSRFSQAAFSYFPPRLIWLRPREDDMNDAQDCPALLTLACCPWPKPELFCCPALRWTLLQSDYWQVHPSRVKFGMPEKRSWGRGFPGGPVVKTSPSNAGFFPKVAQAGKESAYNVGDLGSIPGLGRSRGERNSYPLQYSGLENSMDCIVHGVTKSQSWLSDFHSLLMQGCRSDLWSGS